MDLVDAEDICWLCNQYYSVNSVQAYAVRFSKFTSDNLAVRVLSFKILDKRFLVIRNYVRDIILSSKSTSGTWRFLYKDCEDSLIGNKS